MTDLNKLLLFCRRKRSTRSTRLTSKIEATCSRQKYYNNFFQGFPGSPGQTGLPGGKGERGFSGNKGDQGNSVTKTTIICIFQIII
jgi:hypothetical protein